MTNNDTSKAEQLVRKHLEYINSGLWNDVYGTSEDFRTICESYLLLLEQLKIAKEGFRAIAEAEVVLKTPELDEIKAKLFEYGCMNPIREFAEGMITKLTND